MEHTGSQRAVRPWDLHSYPFYTCHPWMWHHVTTSWHWKRKFPEEIWRKQSLFRDQAEVLDSLSASVEEVSTAGGKSWLTYIMGRLGRFLIPYDTSTFARKWLAVHLTFNPRLYHPHQLQQSITVFVYITRYSSGKEQGMNLYQKNGDGESDERLNYYWFASCSRWASTNDPMQLPDGL